MSLNDPLSNVLSQIKTAEQLGKKEIVTKSNSKFIQQVLDLMRDSHYIGSYETTPDTKGDLLKVNLLGRINNVGVIKPRFSVKKDGYEKFEKRYLPSKGFGILILSTSQGMMTHTQAKEKELGGRLISYCY